jgi:hypothetical protein
MRIYTIAQGLTVVTGEVVTKRLSKGTIDHIYCQIRSTSGLNLIAEDETVPVLVTLTRRNSPDIILCDCTLDDLLMKDNWQGGFSGYNGADGVTKRFKIKTGTIQLQEGDDITIVINFSAITFVAGVLDCFALLQDDVNYTPPMRTIGRTVNIDADFSRAIEMFINDDAAGNTIKITSEERGDEPIYDYFGQAIFNLNGNVESASTVQYAWYDETAEGVDIHVQTPSSLRAVVISYA